MNLHCFEIVITKSVHTPQKWHAIITLLPSLPTPNSHANPTTDGPLPPKLFVNFYTRPASVILGTFLQARCRVWPGTDEGKLDWVIYRFNKLPKLLVPGSAEINMYEGEKGAQLCRLFFLRKNLVSDNFQILLKKKKGFLLISLYNIFISLSFVFTVPFYLKSSLTNSIERRRIFLTIRTI